MNERPILWWYAVGEQKFGPYSEAQLRELAQTGHIQRDDLVWHHGLEGWVPAPSIADLLPAQLPPRPQPASAQNTSTPTAALPEQPPQEEALWHTAPAWQQATLPAAATTTAADAASADPMALFVGNNYAFYARRWAESDRMFGGLISWNWAAFFFSLPWLAYRKMYGHCAVIIAAGLLAMGTAQVMQIPIEKLSQWQANIAPIVCLLMGLFSNWMYRRHAERKVRQIMATHSDPRQAAQQLVQQGGGSLNAALTVVSLAFVASFLVAEVIARFMGGTPL